MIQWFKFTDGTEYCLARDIIDYARSLGYHPPISSDERVHPGSICNRTMRTIIKDAGLRRKYKITVESVVQVRPEYSAGSNCFMNYLVDEMGLSKSTIIKGHIDLYNRQAVEAILSSLMGEHIRYEEKYNPFDIKFPVVKSPKSVEKMRLKPKASLF